MRVVVTGGNSFLGRHLVRFLSGVGAKVFATYRNPDFDPSDLAGAPNVKFIRARLSEPTDLLQLPDRADALVHVAASSLFRPGCLQEFIDANVLGARNILDYASRAGVERAVYTSTISVYGQVHVPELVETSPISNPDDYGLTKYLAERMFEDAAAALPCVALRLPGILGKGAHRAWIPSLVGGLLNGRREFAVYNPESAFNNAAHVDDLVQFIWTILNASHRGYHPVNVAAAGQIRVREIADLMSTTVGERVRFGIMDAPRTSFTISSERAKALGYRPQDIQVMLQRYFTEAGLARDAAACNSDNGDGSAVATPM